MTNNNQKEATASTADAADGRMSRRRRASLQSAFFALQTTSKFFREQKFRPTKIMGVLFLADPDPDISKIRAHTVDQLLKFTRFASFVTLENEHGVDGGERHVMFNPIPINQMDMKYHFKVIHGGGTFDAEQGDLSEMVSEAHLMDWDPTKPLWKLTLVTNLKGGKRSMLFFVADHTIGDGSSLSALLVSLFDKGEDDAVVGGGEATAIFKKKPTSPQQQLKMRFSHRMTTLLYAYYYGIIGWAFVPADPDNCFKFPISKRRAAASGRKCSQTKHIPLEEIKAIKDRLPGTTINDIVTAVATIAIRRYFEHIHDTTILLAGKNNKSKTIRLTFAVNHRPPTTTVKDLIEEGGSNRVVVGNFEVPLDFTSPIDAVWRCKSRLDIYKNTPLIPITWNTQQFLTRRMPWTQLEQLGSDVFFKPTGVISNVMGPTQKASIGGYTIDDFSFYGVASGQGTYLGILSYNKHVRMFICMDKHIDADPQVFKKCLETAYEDLKVATEVASPEELEAPDMTPLVARILEVAFLVLMARLIGWQLVAFVLAVYLCGEDP